VFVFKHSTSKFKNKFKLSYIFIIIGIITTLSILLPNIKIKHDINNMEYSELYTELRKIQGIGHTLAIRVEYNRPYKSFDDLQERVDGIGDTLIKRIEKEFFISRNSKRMKNKIRTESIEEHIVEG